MKLAIIAAAALAATIGLVAPARPRAATAI